jgi:hypothetical protein
MSSEAMRRSTILVAKMVASIEVFSQTTNSTGKSSCIQVYVINLLSAAAADHVQAR